MAKITLFIVAAAAAALMVASATTLIPQQVTCEDAITALTPCLEFVTGKGPDTPSAPCCVGVQKMNQECALKPDRIKVCQCLKDAATKFAIDADRIKSLPGLCSVHLPFPIVRDIDCNKVSE